MRLAIVIYGYEKGSMAYEMLVISCSGGLIGIFDDEFLYLKPLSV